MKRITYTDRVSYVIDFETEELKDIIFSGKHETDNGFTIEESTLRKHLPEDVTLESLAELLSKVEK